MQYGSVRSIGLLNWENSGRCFWREKVTCAVGSGAVWDHISSYRLSLARLGLARLGLAQIAAARLPRPSLAIGLVRNARLRSALEGLGLAWLSSARFRRACLDSDWRGLAQPGPARIGSGRLGSRQFGDLVNFFSFLFRTDRWREKTLYFIAKHVLLIEIPVEREKSTSD